MYRTNTGRGDRFYQWMRNPASHPDWKLLAGSQCGSAPFLFPTDGFVGFLWGDSFGIRHTHQGIDIFAGTDVNITKVISAYPGYLTRLPDWKSSVIVRVPSDPLNPGQQIWLYYTHMADQYGNSFISEEFPAGTSEKYIEAGRTFYAHPCIVFVQLPELQLVAICAFIPCSRYWIAWIPDQYPDRSNCIQHYSS